MQRQQIIQPPQPKQQREGERETESSERNIQFSEYIRYGELNKIVCVFRVPHTERFSMFSCQNIVMEQQQNTKQHCSAMHRFQVHAKD